jgi:hypothetical protein
MKRCKECGHTNGAHPERLVEVPSPDDTKRFEVRTPCIVMICPCNKFVLDPTGKVKPR